MEIKNQINGYMVSQNHGETSEELFNRAKTELLNNLITHIERVRCFSFADYCKKDK